MAPVRTLEIYPTVAGSISKSALLLMGRTKFPTESKTAARQITSYVNKATDTNAAALWEKMKTSIIASTPSDPLGVADLFALAFIRQHCIFAERRPAKAALGCGTQHDPGVRNSSASAVQMGVLQHILNQILGFERAMTRWMALFLELDQSEPYSFLTQGRYKLCLLGGALEEACALHQLSMPVVCEILNRAGWNQHPDTPEELSQLLEQHQAANWLAPWQKDVHLNTFAAVLSQWVGHDLGELREWTLEIALPCLISRAEPRHVYAALLILLGVCKQIHREATDPSKPRPLRLIDRVRSCAIQVLESEFVYKCDMNDSKFNEWSEASQQFRAEQLSRYLEAPPFVA